MGGKHIEPYELDAFVEKYIELRFNFAAAAKAIGRTARGVRGYMRSNEEFAARVRDARFDMAEAVVAEAFRRAVDGYDEPLTHKGFLTGDVVRKYSDAVIVKMLAAVPGFGDKIEVSNPDGSLQASDGQIAARVASILAVAQARKERGEIIDAEIVEPAALPPPDNEDLV